MKLKEQRVSDEIVPISGYYESHKKAGIKWKKEKNSTRKLHCLQLETKQEN